MAVPGMTGGDQKPLLKYNAKTGKWHVDDKVVDKITLLVDLENGESGWVRFGEGLAPDFRLVTMAAWSRVVNTRRCRRTSTARASRCSSAASA